MIRDRSARYRRNLKRPASVRGGEAGFTLVEMMVVIFIIGLLAGAVMLSVPAGGREVRGDAERFAMRVAAARDQAVLQSSPIALWVRPSGYGFEKRRESAWKPFDQRPFAASEWRGGTVARVPDGGVRLVFDSVGLPSDAIDVAIEQDGVRRNVRIDAAGEISIDGQANDRQG